jgi:hypothetical protein
MSPSEESQQKLDRLLRGLPERSAPPGFEVRVMAEIARRASLPWWKRSYASWPLAARLLFFVGSAVAAAILVVGVGRVTPVAAHWYNEWSAALMDVRALGGSLFSRVPISVLYTVGGALALGYATLVGVGSALYRTLTSAPSP